jgi:hypothetical protein
VVADDVQILEWVKDSNSPKRNDDADMYKVDSADIPF